LRNCLRTIVENDYPSDLVEIIVVDNGSTDGSDLVAGEFGATVLRHPQGKVSALRNAGAAIARGEVLAFVDADHLLDSAWLSALASCMDSTIVGAAGAAYTAPPDGTWVQRCYDGLRVHPEGRVETEWLGSGNMAVRRDIFQALGGFDVSLATCEDVDICQRIRAAGHSILSDSALRSVHVGDPRTLKALFLGELWRGRDNLRATLRGPKDWRHLRSAVIPIIYLAAFASLLGTMLLLALGRDIPVVLGCAGALCGLSGLRVLQMFRHARLNTTRQFFQALAVAIVYDLARALALVVRVGHETRRSGETSSAILVTMPLTGRPPAVSFIIPVRDDAFRLSQCLESIARNDYPKALVEVIVVDNESTDGSAWAAQARGAVVIGMPSHQVAALRNAGAARARGEILAFVDADHEIDPDWISRVAATLTREDISAVGAPPAAPPDGNWVQRCYGRLRSVPTTAMDVDWLGTGNLAIKKQVFASVAGFDAALATCEDVELCQRLRRLGHRIFCDPALRNVHYGDPSSLSSLFFGELWRGRDNLRVTLRGPWTVRSLPSIVIPLLNLAALAVIVLGVATADWRMSALAMLTLFGLGVLRASHILWRDSALDFTRALQALVVGIVYDLGRALAIPFRASHDARRFRESRRRRSTPAELS
jgi:glycosyltransferase involved in cell wall biosynthesis